MNLNEYLKDPGIQQRLMLRAQNEYGATSMANFAMSEIGTLMEQEIATLRAQNAELVTKTTADHELIAVLRREIDDMRVKAGQSVPKKHRLDGAEPTPPTQN